MYTLGEKNVHQYKITMKYPLKVSSVPVAVEVHRIVFLVVVSLGERHVFQ
jgi:hypothetical protein